jgi:hypothetical protein
MRQTLKDYGYTLNHVPLLCDNESAIKIAYIPCEHSKTKHINNRHHFLRYHAIKGDSDFTRENQWITHRYLYQTPWWEKIPRAKEWTQYHWFSECSLTYCTSDYLGVMLWNKMDSKIPPCFYCKIFGFFSWSMDQVALIMVIFMQWLLVDHACIYYFISLYINILSLNKIHVSCFKTSIFSLKILSLFLLSDREFESDKVWPTWTMSGQRGSRDI